MYMEFGCGEALEKTPLINGLIHQVIVICSCDNFLERVLPSLPSCFGRVTCPLCVVCYSLVSMWGPTSSVLWEELPGIVSNHCCLAV